MRYRTLLLWLAMIVISIGFGFWYLPYSQKASLKKSETFHPPIAAARISPWNDNELILVTDLSTGNPNIEIWTWDVATGKKVKMIMPTLDLNSRIYDAIPYQKSLLLEVSSSEPIKYYLVSQQPTDPSNWKSINIPGFIAGIVDEKLIISRNEDENPPKALFAFNIATSEVTPFLELPSSLLDQKEYLRQYMQFQSEVGTVHLILSEKHIWRRIGDSEPWTIVESHAGLRLGPLRVMNLGLHRNMIFFDNEITGMQVSFDEGASFEPAQEGIGNLFAPYVFYHAPSSKVITLTPSLQKAFILNPDGKSWQEFESKKPFDILPIY